MNFTQDDETFPRTLYVGNLDLNVSESLITELFSVIGPVKSCKMISDPHGSDPYCFVEFTSHADALRAHAAMNQRKILGKEIRVNWATRPAGKRDTSCHHHIFVGDLAPETTSDDLKLYFGKIAEVSDARVMRDLTTNKSKGYGFVSFLHYQDAQDIVEKKKMVPEALHGRQVRCNWAARKGGQTVSKLDYQTVVNQSSQTNCTVYLGGCMTGLSEQLMKETFAGFGNIKEIRVFPDKGYAFIRFDNHNDAAQAITAKHGSTVEGYTVKCSWGKEGAAMGPGNLGSTYTNGVSSTPTSNGIPQPSMDNMGVNVNQWSPGSSEMWGNQQHQYNQWTQWRGQNQPQQQQPQQQQQNPWNTWGQNQMGSNNPWGAPSQTTTWGGANSNSQQQQNLSQQQNLWGWPTMGQPGGDGWGSSNTQGNSQNEQMWSNSSWSTPVSQQQPQQQNGLNPMLSGSGDPGSQQSNAGIQSSNGFGL